jgi:hypothetical protein
MLCLPSSGKGLSPVEPEAPYGVKSHMELAHLRLPHISRD